MLAANDPCIDCGSCRRIKGIGIFKLPLSKYEGKLRDQRLGDITKTREVDKGFREQIRKDNVHTCEKHFKQEVKICQ